MQKTIPERLVILFFEFDHSNRSKSGLENGSDNYQKIKILLLHRSSGLRVWKLSQMEKSNSTMTVITFTNIFGDHWPPNAVSGSDNFKILLFRLYWKNRYFPIHKWTKNARFRKRNIISATYRNYSFIGVFCTFLSRKCRPNRFLVFLKKNWKNPIHNLSTQSTQIEKKIGKRCQDHSVINPTEECWFRMLYVILVFSVFENFPIQKWRDRARNGAHTARIMYRVNFFSW